MAGVIGMSISSKRGVRLGRLLRRVDALDEVDRQDLGVTQA